MSSGIGTNYINLKGTSNFINLIDPFGSLTITATERSGPTFTVNGSVAIKSTSLSSVVLDGALTVTGTNGFGGTIIAGTVSSSEITSCAAHTNTLTVAGNYLQSVTINASSSGNITNLAHQTPTVILTSSSAIFLLGIESAGVTIGTMVSVLRSGFGTSMTVSHNSGPGLNTIILPAQKTTIAVPDRSCFNFIFTSVGWLVTSYTPP